MSYRIDVDLSNGTIEGFCDHGSWSGEDSVIKLSRSWDSGEWTVASSRCLPSDIKDAQTIQACVNFAFLELQRHL